MMRLRCAWLAASLAFFLAAFVHGQGTSTPELKTIAGKSVTGTLEKITDNFVILNAGGKSVDTLLSQVLDLNLRPGRSLPASGKYIEVQLLDESFLRCNKVTLGAKEAQLELTSGASFKVPMSAFVSVLRDADDPRIKAQWVKLLGQKRRADRIVRLKDGDLNPLEGTLGPIDEAKQTITFKLDGSKEVEIALDKLQGIQFARTDVAAQPPLCKVIDVDGNTLVASKLAYAGAKLDVTTPFGQYVGLDPKVIARFDFNFGRLTYLSDLDARVIDTSLLGGFSPIRKDTNLDGDPIMLQDKKYDKGLSMYAGVELEYDLAGKYKDMKALLGVDSRIAEEGQGKVTVTIWCDKEKRSTFEVSTKAPIPINVNVKDVNTLRIVVSGSNFTGLSGHAMLVNAQVSQ